MKVLENMGLADFEVLEQAEGRVSRGKGAAGEKKWWPAGSNQKVANGCMMHTEPCWEAQNG
jgi:hypothetical protein